MHAQANYRQRAPVNQYGDRDPGRRSHRRSRSRHRHGGRSHSEAPGYAESDTKSSCCMPIWLIVLISILAAVGVGLLVWILWPKSDIQQIKDRSARSAEIVTKLKDPKTTAEERAKLEKELCDLVLEDLEHEKKLAKKLDANAQRKMLAELDKDKEFEKHEKIRQDDSTVLSPASRQAMLQKLLDVGVQTDFSQISGRLVVKMLVSHIQQIKDRATRVTKIVTKLNDATIYPSKTTDDERATLEKEFCELITEGLEHQKKLDMTLDQQALRKHRAMLRSKIHEELVEDQEFVKHTLMMQNGLSAISPAMMQKLKQLQAAAGFDISAEELPLPRA